MKIKFTDQELLYARKLAALRHESKDSSFRNTNRLVSRLNTKVIRFCIHPTHADHFIGLLGEMAYASAVGGRIDTNIYSVRDTGADIGDVEVKTSTWMGNDIELKVQKKHFETKKPSKYVLVRIDENAFRTVEVLGEISWEDFNRHKTIRQYKSNGPVNYIVGTRYLKPL